jgi:hypothetical protein
MTKLRLFKFLALTSVLATLSYGQFGLGKKDAK